MRKKKTRYTQEFKLEAVKLVTEQNYTQSEAANSLGVSTKNLSRWIAESTKSSNLGVPKLRFTPEQEELRQLSKQVTSSKELRLLVEVKALNKEARGSFGSRQMSKQLKKKGYSVGRYQARTLMRKAAII